MHLFTIKPKGKLEWAAYCIKQVALCRGLLITPGMVMVEFPGAHVSSHLPPMITLSIKPSLLMEKILVFKRVDPPQRCSWGETHIPNV